jgi:hypothetical protein
MLPVYVDLTIDFISNMKVFRVQQALQMDRYQVAVIDMLVLPVVLSVMMALMLTFRPWCVTTMVNGIQTCHMFAQVL